MPKPIPASQATAMAKTYSAYMQTLGVDMKQQTHSVGFSLPELIAWLNKMTGIADEIRIFMGDYPDGDPKSGRTTVMLWPYKDGQPARSTDRSLATETDPELPEDGGENGDGDPGNGDGDGDDGSGGTPPGDGDGDPVDPYNDGKLYP